MKTREGKHCIVLMVGAPNDPLYAGVEALLDRERYLTLGAASGIEALKIVRSKEVNIVLLDLSGPILDGLDLLSKIKSAKPRIEVIALSSPVGPERIAGIMKAGAYDFHEKPVTPDLISQIVGKALEKQTLYMEKAELEETLIKSRMFQEIVGKSREVGRVLDVVGMIASRKSSVLICGESGTGKELVARCIHNLSDRRNGPFIKVNCAALNPGVLESELFGHEKGAFTGAFTKRMGRFELADKGTLFLDEIADIPLSTQVKLLRVFQEREFERVGGNEPVKTDVRIVAATNRDLKKAVEEKTLREDFYYRLNVVQINIPPLRKRKEDIPLLVSHFIDKHNKGSERRISGVTRDVMRIFMDYDWPGNVRELENAVESAMALAPRDVIETKYLPSSLLLSPSIDDGFRFPFGTKFRDMELEVIRGTVNRLNGNKTRAARMLGLSLRTVQRKLKETA